MADDFDPLTIPAVMPALVARTKPDGTPTQHAVKWEEGLQAWMKANVANTNTRLNLVSDEIGDVSASVATLATAQATLEGAFASYQVTVTAQFGTVNASIVSESTARANGDSALATQITSLTATVGSNTAAISAEATARSNGDSALASSLTTVDAKANSATASGAVYLAAKAGPGGATAAYGWYITADGSFAGMEALALSGGGSAIGFSANQFLFTDSGTAQQVLAYNGSAFVFQVPIIIQSGTSGARKVSTAENDKIYDASNVLRVAVGINI